MKRHKNLKIVPLFLFVIIFQRVVGAGEYKYHQLLAYQLDDSIKKVSIKGDIKKNQAKDTSLSKSNKKSEDINILDLLNGIDKKRRITSWRLNPKTFTLELDEGVDSSLVNPQLIIPSQKRLETITWLGNMGSPLQSDHFFNRNNNYSFLFSRFYIDYTSGVAEHRQYHLRKPLTLISYSMGGKTSEGEQTLRVLHSQNVNKYLNVGLTYDYFGTKGMYKNQLTKDNLFSLFASYYKNKFSAQGTFAYNRIRNQENGGLTSDYFIQDTTLEPSLVPFKLSGASSEVKQRSFSGIIGYNLINRWVRSVDSLGNISQVKKPIFTLKAMFDANRGSRVYIDTASSYSSKEHPAFYKNFYINNGATHDSVMLSTYETTLIGEIDQLAKLPGLPGLKFWISNIRGKYYYFNPGDFIYDRLDDRIESNHIGIGTFSYSPYLSYNGSLRMYVSGYRAEDKELIGQLVISPWKSLDLPYIKAKIEITDKEPDIFIKDYFSNHFKWNNSFSKEKRFMLGGSIGADKWRFEAGYNLVQIENFLYFDTTGVPNQAASVTVTSAFVQKEFKLGGLHFANRLVWQANTNKDILSLPTFSVFSSLFFECELVKKVLVGQFGANVFYRSKFYANAYSPATGQFYNQHEKQIGEYPVVDAFINFKWKRAVLFFKLDHVNKGVPNNEYFSTIHYPLNQMIFKMGVSWIFYD